MYAHDGRMVDTGGVSGTQADIDRIVDEFVERTAHVVGAVFGSADGHCLAARVEGTGAEPNATAAMGAAMLGLSVQLARAAGETPTTDTHIIGEDVQVWVLDVGRVATLTVFAAPHADAAMVGIAAQRTALRLVETLGDH